LAAPIEEPSEITPLPSDEGEIGVPGGVEDGIPGGVVGGVLSGLPEPPPPAPAPPPTPRVPVRVGGQIRQWRYSPIILNGVRVPFILSVSLSFYLEPPE